MSKLVVLLCAVAMAAAKPGLVAPVTYSAVPAVSSLSQYSSSVYHGAPLYAPSLYQASYVAPAVAALSQAPNSPALVLDAVNGVPLDTPEVVSARLAHYQAKAFSGVHHLRKRSVAPLAYSTLVSPVTHGAVVSPVAPLTYSSYSPYVSAYSAPAVVSSPLTYSAVLPKAYGVHAW
ncbi:pupal cuticle protein C1B [Papilio machaon]|uniref:pupal cuticle protein C1B n=1 Tax=Papilio machaon TaxID=76193 RepID=UPI001E66347B|nr:pupal cuticle protein C1B [Papilio machaon]